MPTVTVIQPTIAEEQTAKIRCAAYCRVSSDSEDQLNSFMAQTRYYSHFFEDSETEELIDIYADEGITGTREDKRDEFQRLMKDCRKGKIDRIYTKSISRFARNTRDCLKNVRELKSLGITIYFEKENIDTANMTDEMMITIMGGLAQEESTSISKNIKWSYQKRFEKGTINVFSAPFGYKLSSGSLIIDEIQAQIVKEIFEMFLNGIGYQRISEICQNKYSSYKDNFSYYGIRYILATHKSIISKEMFEKAQALIECRKHKNILSESPFSGKIICANCGTKYKRKCSGDKIYWVCRRHDNLAQLCTNKRIEEKFIRQSFIILHNKLLFNYKQILVPLQTS